MNEERYTLPPSAANGEMRERFCEDIKIGVHQHILVANVFWNGTCTEAHQKLSTATSLGYMDRPGLNWLLFGFITQSDKR